MPRSLSASVIAGMNAPQTGLCMLALLELSHPSWVTPIRVVNNTVDITHLGNVYTAYPFDVMLPSESDDPNPTASLRIDNVDRRIVREVRATSGDAINVTLKVISAEEPDVVQVGPLQFKARPITWDAAVIEATLTYDDILNRRYTSWTFSPNSHPGVH